MSQSACSKSPTVLFTSRPASANECPRNCFAGPPERTPNGGPVTARPRWRLFCLGLLNPPGFWLERCQFCAEGSASVGGLRSGRLTSSNEGMWVLVHHDSSAAPQTVQTASPVCGTKNFSSVRLYSAPQLHRTIVAILGICPCGTPDQPQCLCPRPTVITSLRGDRAEAVSELSTGLAAGVWRVDP